MSPPAVLVDRKSGALVAGESPCCGRDARCRGIPTTDGGGRDGRDVAISAPGAIRIVPATGVRLCMVADPTMRHEENYNKRPVDPLATRWGAFFLCGTCGTGIEAPPREIR